MNNPVSKVNIRKLINFACEQNGCPELSPRIIVRWSGRMTRAMGRAKRNYSTNMGEISLSIPLFSRASEEEQRNTVIHESCHVIDYFKHGNSSHHGARWQRLMLNCGEKPERCHNVDRTGLKRKARRFAAKCNCREIQITKHRRTKMLKGYRYFCKMCKHDIRLA